LDYIVTLISSVVKLFSNCSYLCDQRTDRRTAVRPLLWHNRAYSVSLRCKNGT